MTTLEKAIKKYLEQLPGCWFVKTFASKKAGRWGLPDFIVCYRGLFYAFEAKTYDDELSPLQAKEIAAIAEAGGLPAIVRSVADVRRILESERRTIIEEKNGK